MSRTALSLILAALVAMPLCAYEYPVSDTAIRKAYFLGVANGSGAHFEAIGNTEPIRGKSLRAGSLLPEAQAEFKSQGSQFVQVGEPFFLFNFRALR